MTMTRRTYVGRLQRRCGRRRDRSAPGCRPNDIHKLAGQLIGTCLRRDAGVRRAQVRPIPSWQRCSRWAWRRIDRAGAAGSALHGTRSRESDRLPGFTHDRGATSRPIPGMRSNPRRQTRPQPESPWRRTGGTTSGPGCARRYRPSPCSRRRSAGPGVLRLVRQPVSRPVDARGPRRARARDGSASPQVCVDARSLRSTGA